MSGPPAFGQDIRDQEFPHLLPEVAFLNHGSYGAVSKQNTDNRLLMLAEYESDPDMFTRRYSHTYWDVAAEAVASFMGTTSDRIALVTNTTDGINAVVKSLTFVTGDAILQHRWTYGAVKNIISYVAQRRGLEVVTVDHVYPIASTDQIVQEYQAALDANPNIKLAVIDHISSQPNIMFPLTELIALCKSRGVMVCVDGAHCIGQVPLNLDTLGADFYATSLHKWLYSPRGCGALYVSPAYTDVIKPARTSFDYDRPFPDCFRAQGTRDDVPRYQARNVIDFYNFVGGMSAITAYNTDLANRMSDMLTTAWGTGRFGMPQEMEAPFVKMLQLPALPSYPLTGEGTSQIMNDLRDLHNIWSPVTVVNNTFYLRLSTNIYCVEADYNRLRDAILDLQTAPPRNRKGRKHYYYGDLC